MIWSSIPEAASSLPARALATTRAARCSPSGEVEGADRERRLGQRRGEEQVVGLVEAARATRM